MINDGVDGNMVVVMAVIHTAVGIGAGILLASFGATGMVLVLGSLLLSWFTNYLIDSMMKV